MTGGPTGESTKCSRLEIIPRALQFYGDRMSIINDALSRVENVRPYYSKGIDLCPYGRGFTLTYGPYYSIGPLQFYGKGRSRTSIYSTSRTKKRSTPTILKG